MDGPFFISAISLKLLLVLLYDEINVKWNVVLQVSIKEYSCCGNIEFARLRLDFIRQGKKSRQAKRSKWTAERRNATKNHTVNDSEQVGWKYVTGTVDY